MSVLKMQLPVYYIKYFSLQSESLSDAANGSMHYLQISQHALSPFHAKRLCGFFMHGQRWSTIHKIPDKPSHQFTKAVKR